MNQEKKIITVEAVREGLIIRLKDAEKYYELNEIDLLKGLIKFLDQFQNPPEIKLRELIYAVDVNWDFKCHESDLSKVMKAEDCRFIGNAQECINFYISHKPKAIKLPSEEEQITSCPYDAGDIEMQMAWFKGAKYVTDYVEDNSQFANREPR